MSVRPKGTEIIGRLTCLLWIYCNGKPACYSVNVMQHDAHILPYEYFSLRHFIFQHFFVFYVTNISRLVLR